MTRLAVACRGRGPAAEEETLERLRAQNESLRQQVAEAEGWYRLLQADHAKLQSVCGRTGREATELRASLNRLEQENKELYDLVALAEGAAAAGRRREVHIMVRFQNALQKVRRYKWAAVAALTIGTLVARDPSVRDAVSNAWERVRNGSNAGADGYVRYAAMIQAREQAEAARREYNDREATLKGDALLEAQDRLRASKARYREARLAFLPELARHCAEAGLPVPKEAAEQLALLKAEGRE